MSEVKRRVFVHIGAPKTGTTYLQERLYLNRGSLGEHGIHYPVGLREDQFFPALDVSRIRWPGFHDKVAGEWDALLRRVRHHDGTVIISHEVLAATRPERIKVAMSDLSAGGAEVHVVMTARDIARQVAADWQEELKNYSRVSFARHLRRIRETDPRSNKLWFWRAQSIPQVLSRWGHTLPPERIHLITVPQRGHVRPDILWERFCEVIGADPAWGSRTGVRRNQSLGVAEATMLRRLNKRLKAIGVDRMDHRKLVQGTIVHETLMHRQNMRRIQLPPDAYEWAEDVAREWSDWIADSGIDVVGDLAELMPQRPPADQPWEDPDRPGPRMLNQVTMDALVSVIEEAARRPDPDMTLPARAARAAKRLRRR
ncbi:MAG TPA: hypothetical protein VGE38_02655 [Nocardioides sp.]|uniref:hypothetical protein n=1 Tax=Nocardioides sp. TaxID=35761 RepID=UPI002EDA547F